MIDQKYKDVSDDYEGCKAAILVSGTNELLVARRGASAPRAPEMVDLPGGRSEEAESPYTTCVRECLEEVGVDMSEGIVMAADRFMPPSGKYSWLLVVEIPRELAAQASPVSEMSDAWTEDIDTFLQRGDAWIPFQLHAHKLLLEMGRTGLAPDYSRLKI